MSYQFFIQPGTHNHYWAKNDKNFVGHDGFVKEQYTGGSETFAPDGVPQYNCSIESIEGLPSGSPFWSSPPEQVKGWGSFGRDLNFLLNCTQTGGGTNPPNGPVDWANIIKEIGGYNNVPTAGKVCFAFWGCRLCSLGPAGCAAGADQPRGHAHGQQRFYTERRSFHRHLWNRAASRWVWPAASDAGPVPVMLERGEGCGATVAGLCGAD